ncbi:MAG TPA: peroxidase family protein [Candidatus Eisenbacteria bacterium]
MDPLDSPVAANCRRLFEARNFDGVIEELSRSGASSLNGERDALLGLAYFHKEAYDQAVRHLEAAVASQPANADWAALLRTARANVAADVHVPVPDLIFFEREPLLAAPVVPPGALPTPGPRPRGRGFLGAIRVVLGTVVGEVASIVLTSGTRLWGRIAGYRDEIWTNWYRRPLLLGVLTLAYMREQLNHHNLKNTYPPGSLTGFVPEGLPVPPGVTHFRTADGTWNNLENPKEGAAGTRFCRNVPPQAIHTAAAMPLLSPNPREISRVLLTREGKMLEVPFLNLLAATWIQFQNHDWVNHGEALQADVFEIPLAEDDPARRRHGQSKMFVGKTQPDPTRMPGMDEPPLTFINEVTHWWDGSQIYGSDQKTVDRLRSHRDGKLRLDEVGNLPADRKGIEETGFVRNWWIGLSMFHTLFAREHNAICDHLKAAYLEWDDHRLFNVARMINAAVMAKIHSVEWTPAILPNHGLSEGLHANWYGLLTNLLRAPDKRKTVADINVRNPELGGVVGNPIDKHGAPFGLTEEFVEVYRLHSLLPEALHLRRIASNGDGAEVYLPETRQVGSRKISREYGMGDLFYSFGTQHPGQLVLNNFPAFMQEMSIPGNPLFDMGAVDILRARERGVPRYNEFRRHLGLNPIRSFDDLTDDQTHLAKLRKIYGDRPEDVEKLDLMIGTLAEGHRPTGFGFGETMFQIFILNATRRLQADRFYTDCYTEEYYTPEGLRWIDKADLKGVLLRNCPELASTGLANVKNAFEPWDGDERLDPARHPLRAFDKALKPDPWVGSAYR